MSATGSRKGAEVWVRQERCTHCGAGVVAAEAVEGYVRGVVYVYCADGCREDHAAGVELWSAWCACGQDALGDTTACAEHLDGVGPSRVDLPLAG